MKRRIVLLSVAGLVGLALVLILLRATAGMPGANVSGWRSALRQYSDHVMRADAGQMEVASAVQASRPWTFRRDMSARSYGTSTFYLVDEPYTGRNGPKPLPYPPVDVWCVQTSAKQQTGRAEPSARWVLVAKHEDLYNADWITHEPAGQTSEQEDEILTEIGCR